LSRKIHRLQGLKSSLERLSRVQESQLIGLDGRKNRIIAEIGEISRSLNEQLVRDLSIFTPGLRRRAELERQLNETVEAMHTLKHRMISSRSRSKAVDNKAASLLDSVDRQKREAEVLETLSAAHAASPPQGQTD
jgi:hypothetical protein